MATPTEERMVEIIINGTKANASLKELAAAAVLSFKMPQRLGNAGFRAVFLTPFLGWSASPETCFFKRTCWVRKYLIFQEELAATF